MLGANAERALKPLGKALLIDPRVPETRRYVGLSNPMNFVGRKSTKLWRTNYRRIK